MRNNYYIFVVAHSIRGRIRRIHIPHYVVYLCCVFALIGVITVLAAVGSYTRMLLKVANYNRLRSEAELLKQKYTKLRNTMSETEVQLASLQTLASEVSRAYGIERSAGSVDSLAGVWDRAQAYRASAEQFQLLLRASYTPLPHRYQFLEGLSRRADLPLDWPLEGRLTGGFGDRLDPFNGEGAFHAGLDISTSYGAPVRAAAPGVVINVSREAGYGMAVLLDHGRGVRTYYAHLSGFNVSMGQVVLGREIIGFVGRSGRSTGPHLHYEVRIQNTPVNPSQFLGREVHLPRGLGD